jgi:hypothetical protein
MRFAAPDGGNDDDVYYHPHDSIGVRSPDARNAPNQG